MNQKPSLLMLSFSWAFLIAFLMTAIHLLLHNFQGELTDPATGRTLWTEVGFVFLAWFVAAETVMLIGAGLYFGAARLFRRSKSSR